jgi:hypothetical protein
MIEQQMDKSIPMPLGLVVKNAVNSRSAARPTPRSVTLKIL